MTRVGFMWLIAILLAATVLNAQDDATKPWPTAARLTAVGIAASGTGDYVSTRYALAQGAREANPLFGWATSHPPADAAVKGAVTGALAWHAYSTLASPRTTREEKWTATIVSGLWIAVNTWVTFHNVGVAHQQQRINAARR